MKYILALFSVLASLGLPVSAGCLEAEVVVYDDGFYSFIEKDARFEVLADDLGWAEGPVWAESLDALLFSDVAEDRVYRWDKYAGLAVYVTPSGHGADQPASAWRGSNGLAIDAGGKLLLAQQSSRQLARMKGSLAAPKPDYEILVKRFDGKSVNSPNDLVTSSSGDVYFTDPPYGLTGFEKSPDIELDFFGVFHLSQAGELSVVSRALEKPNGLALSNDQSVLYVSNSGEGKEKILAISLDGQGQAVSSELFFDAAHLSKDGPGSADGMAMHPAGHLFISIPGGLGILSPQGKLLGKVSLGQVTNMAFDSSGSFLYVTRPNQLLRVKLKTNRQQETGIDPADAPAAPLVD